MLGSGRGRALARTGGHARPSLGCGSHFRRLGPTVAVPGGGVHFPEWGGQVAVWARAGRKFAVRKQLLRGTSDDAGVACKHNNSAWRDNPPGTAPRAGLHRSLLPQRPTQRLDLVASGAELRAELVEAGNDGLDDRGRRPGLPQRSNRSSETLGLRQLLLGSRARLSQAKELHLPCGGFMELSQPGCLH